ncbi:MULTISPECIES: CBS domain-containing protein [Acidithiobacillus]|jgi:CBS domain-containing protein|uniref:CBS domain-containing protein n=4 Tax=Acidithiobacillus TaxID=119977 RepID=A0A179BJB7_ACIFR|nr:MULTISPECIES: CBS domain-containing protein [Acidithiobacillus]MDA8180872.1 CBS domain-containing protein [Acidithiobacillus sp.]MBU2830779.1 CBS domain-containing protein [Acidithiobacillus ferriphilus]MBU2833063.1 CBS domain-containing protein [Acidithiobacillus ferriphilus]MBU2854609.1 CBS domain-containing protein [Acidithiobacillus ferriphilus]MBW9249256.1 CBS domain-containing protein [Acidithiobacillus ferriphilus]
MKTAQDIMTREAITVLADDSVQKVGELLLSSGHHSLPVVDGDGHLVGMIGERDLIDAHRKVHLPTMLTILDGLIPLGGMHEYEEELRKVTAVTAGQLATARVISVAPEEDVDAVAEKLLRKDVHAVPVVDSSGLLLGIISRSDILRHLLKP